MSKLDTRLNLLTKHQNGNGRVAIFQDGTRIIKFRGDVFKPEYPLNVDLRISERCSFGAYDDGRPGFCDFCHESAKQNGRQGDVDKILDKLDGLPEGTEIAMGINFPTQPIGKLLKTFHKRGMIVNVTINQGHLSANKDAIFSWIGNDLIKGLGVSYRDQIRMDGNLYGYVNDYQNTVWHVIAGIDNIHNVLSLSSKRVKKILILGEKNFGFNAGRVKLTSDLHKDWRKNVGKLFDHFQVVSFDNLALEQLEIQKLFSEQQWSVFYQHEHSLYIDAPNERFQLSSRTLDRSEHWDNMTLKEYFHKHCRKVEKEK